MGEAQAGIISGGADQCGGERKRLNHGTISCDQVAWLLDIAERYIPRDRHPMVSRQHEMKKYAMLYEIMEIMGVGFDSEAARMNGTPPDARGEKSFPP